MSKPKQSAVKHATPRKRLTSERALKLRPSDSEEPKEATAQSEEPKGKDAEEVRKGRGKTKRLPGMEDAEIEELEDAAREYANVRDDRMQLTEQEVEMKQTLLTLMKKHKKETYRHDGVGIRIVHENEKVKVRLIKDKDDED
jgi:hypothetical protein